MATKTHSTTVRLDDRLYEALCDSCTLYRQDKSVVIKNALTQYLFNNNSVEDKIAERLELVALLLQTETPNWQTIKREVDILLCQVKLSASSGK